MTNKSISFIDINNEKLLNLIRDFGLPTPYLKNNIISELLRNAMCEDAEILSESNHINRKTNRLFKGFSYYSDAKEPKAFCSKESFGYLSTISIQYIYNLVKICSNLEEPVIERLVAHTNNIKKLNDDGIVGNKELDFLLENKIQTTEEEAINIASKWEISSNKINAKTLFYDIVRIIWIHEWAHALCGHVSFAEETLNIKKLYEFSTNRIEKNVNSPAPKKSEILQSLEIHADEFSVRYCTRQLLFGHDPNVVNYEEQTNLVTRLSIFNLAFCLFTVSWSLSEDITGIKISDMFYPPSIVDDSLDNIKLFEPTNSSHPPAILRYDRFRNFQREETTMFGLENKDFISLNLFVDSVSYSALGNLSKLSPYFGYLYEITPFIARTPLTDRIIAYESYLLKIGKEFIENKIKDLIFVPQN